MKKALYILLTAVLFFFLTAPLCVAGSANTEETTNSLSYEKAVDLALKNSIDLRNARQSVVQAEEIRDRAAELRGIGYLPVGPGYNDEDAAARSVLLSFLQADISWQMAKKQVEITEEAIAFQVRAAFDDVRKKINEIELAGLSLDFTALKLKQAKIKVKYGAESPFNLQDIQSQYNEEKQRKELLDKQLSEAYLKLNNLLGLEESERYDLEDETSALQDEETSDGLEEEETDALEEDDSLSVFLEEKIDLDAHISRALSDHPSIWLQEQKIKLAEYELELYTYNVGAPPYAAKQIEVTKEKNNLASLRQNVETALRSSYYQLKQMEDQYRTLEESLSRAENMLKMTRVRHSVGMAITSDIRQAELAVAQIQIQMENILIAYEQLKQLFYKPWLNPAI